MYGITACRSGKSDGLDALQHVSTARIQLYGANDWHTLSTGASIGICLVQMKHYAEAEPGLLRAVRGLEADRGPGFLRTQAAYQALHDLYAGLGNPDEAARWAAKIQPTSSK